MITRSCATRAPVAGWNCVRVDALIELPVVVPRDETLVGDEVPGRVLALAVGAAAELERDDAVALARSGAHGRDVRIGNQVEAVGPKPQHLELAQQRGLLVRAVGRRLHGRHHLLELHALARQRGRDRAIGAVRRVHPLARDAFAARDGAIHLASGHLLLELLLGARALHLPDRARRQHAEDAVARAVALVGPAQRVGALPASWCTRMLPSSVSVRPPPMKSERVKTGREGRPSIAQTSS